MFEKLVAPKTEEEIIKHWKHIDKIYTSVICIVFNQDKYIRDAIDSFLAQVTEYKFEIIIHDDVSTDSTRNILKEYKQKYPSIIKLILQDVNQFTINGAMPFKHSFSMAEGEYIAICEGDDFWVDENKLQRQITELKNNMGLDLCFHSALYFDGSETFLTAKYAKTNSVIKVESVIGKDYGSIATASLFLRREALDEYLDFVMSRPWLTVGDIYIHFFSAKRGGAFYINTPMSVYNVLVEGSWTQTLTSRKLENHTAQRIIAYHELDELTKYKYSESINKSNRKSLKYFLFRKNVPLKNRFNYFLKYRKYFNVSLYSLNCLLGSSVPFYVDIYISFKNMYVFFRKFRARFRS